MKGGSTGVQRKCRICHEYGHRADNSAYHPLQLPPLPLLPLYPLPQHAVPAQPVQSYAMDSEHRVATSLAKRRRREAPDIDLGSDAECAAEAVPVVKARACSVCNCIGHRADNKKLHPDAVNVVLPVVSDPPPAPPCISTHDTGCDPQLRCKSSPHGPSLSAVIQELLAAQQPYIDENQVVMRL
jgi:hypothetical protein